MNDPPQSTGAKHMMNPIQTKGIERADKRKGRSCLYFSMSRAGRISWADWFNAQRQST